MCVHQWRNVGLFSCRRDQLLLVMLIGRSKESLPMLLPPRLINRLEPGSPTLKLLLHERMSLQCDGLMMHVGTPMSLLGLVYTLLPIVEEAGPLGSVLSSVADQQKIVQSALKIVQSVEIVGKLISIAIGRTPAISNVPIYGSCRWFSVFSCHVLKRAHFGRVKCSKVIELVSTYENLLPLQIVCLVL
jgi:hypothetical protein